MESSGCPDAHKHCLNCVAGVKCSQQGLCPVILCPMRCGLFTHGCKMEDHVNLVCPLASVDCPNRLYGCPKSAPRRHLSAHLSECPAYTIFCPYSVDTERPAPDVWWNCSAVMRRDNFLEHMRDHASLIDYDGWLVARCPLSHLGCDFTARRWRPLVASTGIVFRRELDAYVSCWEPDEAVLATVCRSDQVCHLLGMPPEVLVRIGSYLDGLSLSSLSLTCKRLRSVCYELVRSKGHVSRVWAKRADGKWEQEEKIRWRLNRNKEANPGWEIDREGTSAFLNHLMKCPFNVREPKSSDPKLVMFNDIENQAKA